ncbi:MAG: exodeoxyribonuclease VII small subunit [Candidatus Midichloria sp.]|uniref:Exodeoxyribonuclease VII small subunit n=1 Tax=Hyalomma marginatum TaxID=34627 RepID=A0A8S4C2I0_9ACAR|nr:exodeoxyribonuclease VII small subunit [Hyalomma marginatum]CAG7594224.1 exodeoxyribonuclease VII small subunit [Hyalomma marginatum]
MNVKKEKINTSNIPDSFEEALKELETIAAKLEAGEVSLNETVELYKRGRLLHDFCAAKLEEAQLAVNNIITDDNGQPIDTTQSDLQRLYNLKNKLN